MNLRQLLKADLESRFSCKAELVWRTIRSSLSPAPRRTRPGRSSIYFAGYAAAGVGAGRTSAPAPTRRGSTCRPCRGAAQRMIFHIEANAARPSLRSRMPQTAKCLAAAQSGSTMPIKPVAYNRVKSPINTTGRNR